MKNTKVTLRHLNQIEILLRQDCGMTSKSIKSELNISYRTRTVRKFATCVAGAKSKLGIVRLFEKEENRLFKDIYYNGYEHTSVHE